MTQTTAGRMPRQPAGNIDSVSTEDGALQVTGWTLANRVTLCCAGRSVSGSPHILRRDAAEALGVAVDAARYGYELTLDNPGPGPALLIQESATGKAGDLTATIVPGTGGTPPTRTRCPGCPGA